MANRPELQRLLDELQGLLDLCDCGQQVRARSDLQKILMAQDARVLRGIIVGARGWVQTEWDNTPEA